MIVMFLILMFSVNALQFNVEPKTIYQLPAMITLTIYNDDNKTYDLSVDSYILDHGSEKFFVTTDFELQPFKTKILKRYIPAMDLNDVFLIWKVYGDYNKIIKVSIMSSYMPKESTNTENIKEEQNNFQKSTRVKNTPNKAELCRGIVYLFSPTRGVSKVFNSDEKILLNIDYNDAIKSIISDWHIKPVSDEVYELSFPSKTKPYYNKIEIEFEHCGTKELEFYVKNPKNDSLLIVTIILIFVVIFVAFYAELAYLDHKKTHERIHRQLRRSKEKSSTKNKRTKPKKRKK